MSFRPGRPTPVRLPPVRVPVKPLDLSHMIGMIRNAPTPDDAYHMVRKEDKRLKDLVKKQQTEKKKQPLLNVPAQFVTVVVSTEPNQVEFVVHKDLACHTSDFFTSAFRGNFIEGKTQTLILDDVDPVAFRLLAHWMYFKEVYMKEDEALSPDTIDPSNLLPLVKLWLLAGRLLMPPLLQNNTMTQIYRTFHLSRDKQNLALEYIQYVYETVEQDRSHPLKAVAVDLMVGHDRVEYTKEASDLIPKELLWDACEVLRIHTDDNPPKLDIDEIFIAEDDDGTRTTGDIWA